MSARRAGLIENQPNGKERDSLREVRDRIVNMILVIITIFGFPAMILSMPRNWEFGFRGVQYLIHAEYALVVLVTVFRRRLPFVVRSLFLIAATYVTALASLYSWGLIGMYSVFLMANVFLAAIFMSVRAGLVLTVATVGGMALMAAGVYFGLVTHDIDYAEYARSPSSWLLSIAAIAFYAAITLVAFNRFQHALVDSIDQLGGRTAALESTNVQLEQEISERRKLQEQFLHSQKMEAVGRLAGGVAHDFNNQLLVILGMSGILESLIEKDDPNHSRVQMIRRAAERSAGLTRQLLAFSRKQLVEPKLVDLNCTVSELEKMLVRLIGEDIRLVNRPAPGLSRVMIDPAQLEQVIVNLAVNARDAMPMGGNLIIETADILIDLDYAKSHISVKPGRYVMFAVNDSGVGMDRETMSHIFEPFFTTKGTDRGTGLGLATVYGIVKQAGGDIIVYSEPGSGSTFKIYLPAVEDGAAVQETEPTPQTLPRGDETILVVEDEEHVRETTVAILLEYGYRVLAVESGERALEVLRDSGDRIDLIITDVVMTGMNGKELADRVQQIDPRVKVLFMSGYADKAILDQGVPVQRPNFIQKPFTVPSLLQEMRRVFEQQQ